MKNPKSSSVEENVIYLSELWHTTPWDIVENCTYRWFNYGTARLAILTETEKKIERLFNA